MMKKSVLCSMLALIFSSAAHISAEAPKAVNQLATQAPVRQAAVLPEARVETTAVIITEKGRPVKTIFFEMDKAEDVNIFGNNDNGYNNGRLSCVAQDTGWEEHWGGHGGGPSELNACRECLKEHGSCRYNCSVQQFRCTAQFNCAPVPIAPGHVQPPLPAPFIYTGDLRPDQGSARDSAILRCMQSTQGQPGYCSVTNCDTESQIVRSGSCRK